jgi:hypothetical protein
MFIVKHGFRNLGELLTAGSEIKDPAVIKHFRSRLGAQDIIVVNEQNYETCKAYFKTKWGKEIPSLEPAEPVKPEVVATPVKSVQTTVVKPTVTVKATVK